MPIDVKILGSSSAGNGYLVSDGYTPVLLECGLPIKQLRNGTGYSLAGVAGCLISHEHQDHSKAAKDLLRQGVRCYMSRGTAEAIGTLDDPAAALVQDQQQIRVGSWDVMPFRTVHDAAEPLGFLLASGADKLLFLTDSAYSPFTFRGLTHILIECNYIPEVLDRNIDEGRVNSRLRQRLLHSHFGLPQVLKFLKANDLSRVQGIWLLHLSDANSDEHEMKRAVQRATGLPVHVAPR